MKKLTLILGVVLALAFVHSGCKKGDEPIKGIKIYDFAGDYEDLASAWKKMGINTCFAGIDMMGDQVFRSALKKRDIQTFLIFPVFHNPDILKSDPTLAAITREGEKARSGWVEFVCPSRETYRASKVKEAAEMVEKLDPDVISIDFIRHFVFWEMVYPDADPASLPRSCYCDSCLARFTDQYHLVFPDSCLTTPQKARFIDAVAPEEWNQFRCNLITTMASDIADVARAVKPGIRVNIHAVPWRESDFDGARIDVAGQDLASMASFADYISPMCYSQMLKRDPEWISDVVNEMERLAPGKILPSIQVDKAYIDREFTAEEFGRCLQESLKAPSLGVAFFSWPLFVQDSARIEIARKIMN